MSLKLANSGMFTDRTSIPECIHVAGQTVRLIVRFSKQSRRMLLRVNHQNQIVVSVPSHISSQKVLSFVERQHLWLKKQIMLMPKVVTVSDWLEEHPLVSASGKSFHTQAKLAGGQQTSYQFEKNSSNLTFYIPQGSSDVDVELLKLVKLFSKDALACRIGYHATRLNLGFERLTVRNQATRWGSCSSKRCISLNWRLILIEPKLQDYVILHELAHLTEMNHSKRFWELLDYYDPLRRKHEADLKKVTPVIMRIGRD